MSARSCQYLLDCIFFQFIKASSHQQDVPIGLAIRDRSAPVTLLSPAGSGAISLRMGAGGAAWPILLAMAERSAPVTLRSSFRSGSRASNASLSGIVSAAQNIRGAVPACLSIVSRPPSLSSSGSQMSPRASPSKFSWPPFGVVGQLSTKSGTSSPSPSGPTATWSAGGVYECSAGSGALWNVADQLYNPCVVGLVSAT